jgi:hypothetical protein
MVALVCVIIFWSHYILPFDVEYYSEDHNGNKFYAFFCVILGVFYMCNIYYVLFCIVYTFYMYKFYLINQIKSK